ncbi:MBL fold metallo-hydrolase [Yinghuangia soli]|uniref:MBL fold metallo-hydrolase n=1 Tax=Yinghuangia soli TaxID=2908204 RepID=A0AA41Q811_9ACTN|nr:MBL fold metallo-hydrolase [Yinghuangia soli]MCF2532074.1 MBL fold metallo-hydrolase [Yinghuangia soli]
MSVSHYVHEHGTIDPPAVEEVADGAFAYIQPDGTWWINNTGFLVGDGGAVAIDTCATERRTRLYLGTIERVAGGAPVRTLVNTHHHGDHTHGNYLVPGATIVAHEKTRAEVLRYGLMERDAVWPGVDWGDLRVAAPFLTFAESVTLHVGDLRAEVRHFGTAAHTSNDSVVWLPDQRVVYTGDLIFNGGTPFLLMGSPIGYLHTLERLRELDAATLVPGHGPVCGPEQIDVAVRYTAFLMETAAQGRAAGLDPLAAAYEADLGEWAELSDPERLVGNLHRAYAELSGGEVDTYGALADMIAYNDGKPLTCYA